MGENASSEQGSAQPRSAQHRPRGHACQGATGGGCALFSRSPIDCRVPLAVRASPHLAVNAPAPTADRSSETSRELVGPIALHPPPDVRAGRALARSGLGATAAGIGAYTLSARLAVRAFASLVRYELHARVVGPSAERACAQLARWSRRAWSDLHLDVQVHGTPSAHTRLYVANHRSYLDILVLSGVLGGSFLSRSDVAQWPLVGTVAKAIEAVFVDRNDTYGRARAARELSHRLRQATVVAFPEGTTTWGRLPGTFHQGLFRLLRRLKVPLVPLTIRYSDPRAYWTDDISLARHLRTRVLTGPRLRCTVHIGDELDSGVHADAADLTRAAYEAICRPIEEFGELA